MSSKSSKKSSSGGSSSSASGSASSAAAVTSTPTPAAATATTPPVNATLQVFWDLAKEDVADRLAACERLLIGLQAEQKSFQPSDKKKSVVKEEDENDDEEGSSAPLVKTVLSPNLCPSLTYALKRLTRGLASSRAGARQGFALALTEILVHMPIVQTEDVLAIVADQVKLSQKANKQETRDYHLGRVFFALVLVRSGRVSTMSPDGLANFVNEIIEYAKSNLPIREVSYETVAQLVQAMEWNRFDGSKLQRLMLKEFCNQSLENLSMEQIGLSLKMKEYYERFGHELPSSNNSDDAAPSSDKKDSSAPLLVASSVRKLFSSKYLPALHSAMFSAMQHYSIAEKLHTSWSTIILHLWTRHSEEKFQKWWKENVEEALFGGVMTLTQIQQQQQQNAGAASNQVKSTSYQKKFIGFQVVQQVLTLLPKAYAAKSEAAPGSLLHTMSLNQVLSVIFSSRNFLRTFTNHMTSHKNVLHKSTIHTKAAILALTAKHPDAILTITSHLEDPSKGGHPRFDSRTNSNLIVKLLEGLNVEGIKDYIEKLIQTFIKAEPVVLTDSTDEKKSAPSHGKKSAAAAIEQVDSTDLAQQSLDSQRIFCIDQLFLLARNKNLDQGPWLRRAIDFLFYYGFFTATASSKSLPFPTLEFDLSDKVRTQLQDKLFHLLNELLPHAPVSKRSSPTDSATKKGDKKKTRKNGDSDDDEEEEEDVDMTDGAEDSADIAAAQANFHALFSSSSTQLPWILQLQKDWSSWLAPTGTGKKSTPSAVQLSSPLTEEQAAARTKMLAFVDDLRSRYEAALKKHGDGPLTDELKIQLSQSRSLQLLLLHLGLLLLKEEDRDFAMPLMEEIQEGFEKMLKDADSDKKKKKSTKKAAAEDESNHPLFINVLIDILLSLLIRPSTLFREIARSTFLAFITSVNEEALDELLLVLRRKEKSGQAEDDEDEDEADFEEDDEDEEEEEEEDEAETKKKVAAAKKSAPKKLSMDEQAALNAAKFAKFAATSDSEGDDSDEEMVDLDELDKAFEEEGDDEELAGTAGALDSYDTHLGNIVRLRNEKRTVHKETQQQSLHFKLRVCDLLELFIRHESANPLVYRMPIPMLLAVDAARSSKETQQLQQRLVGLFKKLTSAKEHPTVTKESEETIRSLMTTLMARAVRTSNRETLHLTNLSLLSLAKQIIPHEMKAQIDAAVAATSGKKAKTVTGVAFVIELYRKELIQYLSVRHSNELNTKFFTDFLGKFPGLAWVYVDELSALARAKLPEGHQIDETKSKSSKGAANANKDLYAASHFRRIECFTLLLSIFNRRGILKEHGLTDKFASSLPHLIEAIRSSLIAATLPKTETGKDEDDESDSDDEEEVEPKKLPKIELPPETKAKLSPVECTKLIQKLERQRKLKLRLRAKKKRRIARRKAAEKLAAETAEGKLDAAAAQAKKEAAEHKTNLTRLKVVLKCANQAALTMEGQGMAPLASTLSTLPATLATPLKAAINTFMLSAKIDPSKVKLQIDPSVLNKPNPNQDKKKPSIKKDDGKKSNGKKEESTSVKKKSNNRNLIQPSSPASAPSKESKKRSADSDAINAESKKQKTAPSTEEKPSKKQKRQDGDSAEEKKSKKSKA